MLPSQVIASFTPKNQTLTEVNLNQSLFPMIISTFFEYVDSLPPVSMRIGLLQIMLYSKDGTLNTAPD